METHTPKFDLGPITFDLTVLAMTILTVVLVFSFVLWASQTMTLKPKGKQNVLEWIYEFVIKVISPNLGPTYAKQYSLFYFTLFTFLVLANNLGLVAKIEGHHELSYWMSPTANMFYALALSLMISLYNNYQSLKINGAKGFFKEFITPPAMTFFHVMEEFTNILSLGLRLFGNIFAGEVVIDLILKMSQINFLTGPLGFLLSLVWIGFSVFISCLQAYVFVLLSSMYLGKKINHHEH
ncbi:F-type H+-transporting ATPase subunit a [Streptococcus rupicaprae]|uniref:ATP synthase subunit a n=1 Tax=Streptococcus rupicaprae TaxID=759619 RepID=A0ABV2FI95_9STRE